MKQITIDMLEAVESSIENDEEFKIVRRKIQEAVDKSLKSVTLEAALEQVKNFNRAHPATNGELNDDNVGNLVVGGA